MRSTAGATVERFFQFAAGTIAGLFALFCLVWLIFLMTRNDD